VSGPQCGSGSLQPSEETYGSRKIRLQRCEARLSVPAEGRQADMRIGKKQLKNAFSGTAFVWQPLREKF
jgi:hypothetical protein